jgi:class 3 adenylate cyclase/tetratricopeptide (TPR) repeat protein
METLAAYIPMDRLLAMVSGEDLPGRASGAVLFADISGSTPLAEALVKELGRQRGAEEFTGYLNAVFEALVAEVCRYGGSVISFSGDAITCWLDGDNGLRAVACGLAMQQAMQPFARLRTPMGTPISLAVKVAVTVGPVRRFQVGDPSTQSLDVLVGGTVDRVAAAEKKAMRGEVVVGAEVVAALGDQVQVAEVRSGEGDNRLAVIKGLTGTVEESPWPSLAGGQVEAIDKIDLRSWLLGPVYERLQHGQGRFLAEILPAAALFLHFKGIEYDDDEAAGQKLGGFIQRVQRSVTRHGGYLLQVTHGDHGSYLYASFGAPVAHGDDAVRAVAAALELQSLPIELGFIDEVRVGISLGRIWAGAYGAPTRCTYGALGNEVNVAARLMEKARSGEVVVSQYMVDATSRHYLFDYRGPVAVKGQSGAVPIFVVEGEYVSPPPLSPPVGREAELARLDRLQAEVLDGAGRVVRLEGEAGVGKSCLAAELIRQASEREFRVAVGICQSTTQAVAYHPWRQVFRALLELEAGLSDNPPAQVQAAIERTNRAWLPRLPLLRDLLGLLIPDNPTTPSLTPRLRQQMFFALAVEMIQTWAKACPLLLLVEDAHWLDEASRGLLLALGRSIADVPVLLVVVHRPQENPLLPDLDFLPHHHLAVRELALPAVEALVKGRLNGRVAPLVVALIHAQAQGNPFFTEELVDMLRESGVLVRQADGPWALAQAAFDILRKTNCLMRQGGGWTLVPGAVLPAAELGIPDSVHSTVLARLDRLPEAHRLTLKVAGVIGPAFEMDLLAQAHPSSVEEAVLRGQMADMEARALIYPETPSRRTYRFKHAITQEVVYGTLPSDQRSALHRSVGEGLERLLPEAVERLAYHYSRSGARDKALVYLDKAARRAQRAYAYETALNYYDQALALEERWEWRKEQVEALHVLGRRDDEWAGLESLAKFPAASASTVAFLQGQYHEELGNYPEAQTCVENALLVCRREGDQAGLSRCLSYLGRIARRQGEYERAEDWYRRALEVLQKKDISRDEEIQALNGLGTARREQGEHDGAGECYHRALALSRQSGNRMGEAEALDNLGVTATYQVDFDGAAGYHRQALEIRCEIGDRAGEGASLGDLAMALRGMGDYGAAWDHLSQALAIQQAIGNRRDEANVWNDMGAIYLVVGDLSNACDCFGKGLALSRAIGDEAGQAYFLANLGLVAHDRLDLAGAEKLLAEGLTLALRQGDRRAASFIVAYQGRGSLLAGQFDRAIEQAAEALALHQELGQPLWTTSDLAILAEAHLALGNMAQALDYAHQTLAVLDECDGQGLEYPHRDYFICYRVLSAAGQMEAAGSALRAAYTLVMACAEKIADPALRRSFLERVQANREIVQEYEKISSITV